MVNKLLYPSQSQLLQRISFIIVIMCCLITFCYGLAVLFGKQFNYPLVMQIEPTAHVMVYDTAISFCVAGIGLLAIFFNRNYITMISVIFLIMMSILTIIQYIISVDWDITRSMIFPFLKLQPNQPSKMHPLTPFCFLLTAMAFMHLMQKSKISYQKFMFSLVQGMIILCLSILFFIWLYLAY